MPRVEPRVAGWWRAGGGRDAWRLAGRGRADATRRYPAAQRLCTSEADGCTPRTAQGKPSRAQPWPAQSPALGGPRPATPGARARSLYPLERRCLDRCTQSTPRTRGGREQRACPWLTRDAGWSRPLPVPEGCESSCLAQFRCLPSLRSDCRCLALISFRSANSAHRFRVPVRRPGQRPDDALLRAHRVRLPLAAGRLLREGGHLPAREDPREPPARAVQPGQIDQ